MANVLSADKQIAIIGSLCEGSSIRSIERITGVVYAWAHDTDDPVNPRRHVTVLHAHPIKSAQDAVRAAIIQEFKGIGTAEEA
jgi:hypothetical protein